MPASVDNTISYQPFASLADSDSVGTCGVSVIIPAHNAATTLEATLKSLVNQTRGVWEAIMIDDGSTDRTRAMAEHWAQRDRRFRVLHQERLGVCAARNRGLQEARHPFVLFLDSDDRIAPTHLERMVGKLAADSTLDAVHCGWQNILASGVTGRPHLGSDERDLFQYFAIHCHFAIHACVLRRDLALAVGGFDVSLTTCEDWDFFSAGGRSGARFGRVPEVLAFYHIRADSASRDGRRYVTDALVVLDRGHRRDPRVRIAAKEHLEGAVATGRNFALYNIVMYWALQEIGAGRDGLSLLEVEDLAPAPGLQAAAVAEIIQEIVPVAANRSEEDWTGLWNRVSGPLAAFLVRLEAKARVPALAFATLRHLEKKILLADPGDAPLLVGSTYRVSVDLARRVCDISLPPQADRLICRLTLKGEPIAVLELPGVGALAGRRIAEAALEGRGLRLFRPALTPERSVHLSLRVACNLSRGRMLRLIYCVVAAKPKDRLDAARRVKREVASVARANVPRVLAPRPESAARQANQKWQKSVDAAAAAGRAAAREQLAPPKSRDWWDRFFASPDTSVRLASRHTCSVPILMYHRIAAGGPIALSRFRLAPDLFAAQIATLHRAGYCTVGFGDWISAMIRNEPLPGKPIILTFDDGYQEFLTAAMPVLRYYGFSATVFLVADRIGGAADWDAGYGEAAPLLSWQEVRALQEAGTEFGCHSAVHRPMTGMHLTQLTEDTARSRAILEEGLANGRHHPGLSLRCRE